jgi:hypothetical protein
MRSPALLLALLTTVWSSGARADTCVDCHKAKSPGIVADWQNSRHATEGVGCDTCHGSKHTSDKDAALAGIPTPATCAECHQTQVDQFSHGKHAAAWAAQNAMPTIHHQPDAMIEGMKGCGGCHKIGLKSQADIEGLKKQGNGFGVASCDACHTRHSFSKKEAQQPQACQTCHMGFDHPQWEMYSSSKHGVRALLKQTGTLPESASAPTCQTCHMQQGNHEVRTPWGFLAVRLPLSDDPTWKADQVTILQALGVLDLKGNPTKLLDVVKAADVARLDQASFDRERQKMLTTCTRCHSLNFAKAQLKAGDEMIREADHLLAEAIRVVAGLYQDGLIPKPETYPEPFPFLLTFHDAPTEIEQTLFEMHLEHRMRTFQAAFHANPDYATWYGWSEMRRALTEIKTRAGELRERKATHASGK